MDRRRSRCGRTFRPCARTCRTPGRAARSLARPPATRASRPSRSPRRRPAAPAETEPFARAVEHRAWPRHFGLANGRRRLDVHDHRMLEIDEVVVGVGEERAGRLSAAVQRAAGSVGEIDFGSTGVAPPKAASSRTARYSPTARLERRMEASGLAHASGGWRRRG